MIHPVLAAGQIEGGVAQGIGFALYENVVWQERPHGQQPDDELHHADRGRCAADSRLLRGDALRATVRPGAKGIGELAASTVRRRRFSMPSNMRPARAIRRDPAARRKS